LTTLVLRSGGLQECKEGINSSRVPACAQSTIRALLPVALAAFP
jgi:hypothetical protein